MQDRDKLNLHIEKCRRCRKEMIAINESDQIISQIRKITPRLRESETVTNQIFDSIDQPRISKTKAFDYSMDKLMSLVVMPRVRIGFIIIMILLAGSYLTQETMIAYNMIKLEDRLSSQVLSQMSIRGSVPGISSLGQIIVSLEEKATLTSAKALVKELEQRWTTIKKNQINPLLQSFKDLQYVPKLLENHPDLLRIALKEGIGPKEMMHFIRHRREIMNRIR